MLAFTVTNNYICEKSSKEGPTSSAQSVCIFWFLNKQADKMFAEKNVYFLFVFMRSKKKKKYAAQNSASLL